MGFEVQELGVHTGAGSESEDLAAILKRDMEERDAREGKKVVEFKKAEMC